MRSFLPLFAAAVLSSAPALAQSSFHASLAEPASAQRIVARETLWSCAGQDCRAARSGHYSDMSECRQAARKLGRVIAFWAGEKPFEAGDLARCNAETATAAR